jgi:hypothetical protein
VLLLWPAFDFSSAITFVLGAGQALTIDSWIYGIVAALLIGAVALVWFGSRKLLLLAYVPIALALILAKAGPLVALITSGILVALLYSRLPASKN